MIRYYADDDDHGTTFDPEDERADGESEGRDLGQATVTRETDKAILVVRADLEELWVPKSCIHDDSEVFSMKSCGPGKLIVAEWWAEENGVR